MLDLGFLPQIRDVLRRLPRPPDQTPWPRCHLIEMIAHDFMRSGASISMPAAPLKGSPTVYVVKEADKRNCLPALLDQELARRSFTRRKIDADWLYAVLDRKGIPVARIHADQSQNKRRRAQDVPRGRARILVATDIAGRGIDIPGIEHVINFDIPENVEDYVHRAGRTARGRAKGIVATIATWQDLPMVRKIEETLGEKVPRCTVPGVEAWEESEKKATAKRRRV